MSAARGEGELSWDGCARLCERVLDALDWEALGAIYFHADGERELRARRARLLEQGMGLARAVLRRLSRDGRSLHVGAGLVELPVLIAECRVRARTVRAVNLRRRECEVVNEALRRHGLRELRLEPVDAAAAAAAGGYDHLGCISVFTDPETWPLLSDVAYGRIAPVQLDVERFLAEREAARGLARSLFGGLARPATVTTTAEEAAWFLEAAAAAGVPIEADDELLPTAIVGDPVGFLRVA